MNISKRMLQAFLAACISIAALTPAHAGEGDQQFADLGECKLESGEVIKDCRIGYRTRGTLNADKSNAVVVLLPMPVWWERDKQQRGYQRSEGVWMDPSEALRGGDRHHWQQGVHRPRQQQGAARPEVPQGVRARHDGDRPPAVLKEALKLDKVYALLGEQLGRHAGVAVDDRLPRRDGEGDRHCDDTEEQMHGTIWAGRPWPTH